MCQLNPENISTRKAELDETNKKLWWTGPEILLDVVEKWPSQEFWNCVKEKETENISEEMLVCSIAVEPLNIGVDKISDLERFSSMDRLSRITSYVLWFPYNIKSRVIKSLKISDWQKFSKTLWLKYEQGLIMLDRNCNYEKIKHSLSLYEDKNKSLRLKSRFECLET